MALAKHKMLLVVSGTVVIAVLLVLWCGIKTGGPLQVAFMYATNDLSSGISGVFRIQNDLKQYVHVRGALVQKKEGSSWAIAGGAQLLGPDYFSPGTNILRVAYFPRDEGPYRLLVLCLPVSKEAPEYYKSFRYRLASFVRKQGLLQRLWSSGIERAGYAEWRLDGMHLVPSQPFPPFPLNKPDAANPAMTLQLQAASHSRRVADLERYADS